MSVDRIPEEKKGKVKRKIAERANRFVSPSTARWMILAIASIIATAFLTFGTNPVDTSRYEVGEIANETIRANETYEIFDKEATEARRESAAKDVRSVFNADPTMTAEAADRIRSAFSKTRTRLAEPPEDDEEAGPAPSALFSAELGSDLDEQTWTTLKKHKLDSRVEDAAVAALSALEGQYIVGRGELRSADRERGITLTNVRTEVQPETVLTDMSRVVEVDRVEPILQKSEALSDLDPALRKAAVQVASAAVRPNLSYAPQATDNRRARARDAVPEVYILVPAGKIIIDEGHEVTAQQVKILNAIREDTTRTSHHRARLVGLLILTAGVFGGMYFFGSRFTRVVPSAPRDLAVLASLVLIGLMLARLAYELQSMQGGGPSSLPSEAYPYVVPIPLIAMVAALLFDAQVAAFVAVTAALLAGQMFEGSLAATTSYFLASIAAAGALEQPTKRLDVFKAGFAAAGATVAVTAAYALTSSTPIAGHVVLWQVILGLLGGMIASILAIGIVPAFEALGYVTNFRLQELGSLNNPLLRELNLRAPGTYNHSVIVGTLAEAAAESVEANPLYARVACYYHDIGKMRKPMYFIENQAGGENRHDKLAPSMSALIVEAHVKDGYEMALAHGLPRPIADIIPQHHGTRLISFFYNKARRQAEEAGEDPDGILETDFRYPGPKPQTREAGIIMLADGCEAATRSIQDPTPAKIEGMIRRVFNMVWTDGQLDECDLTLKDLVKIAQSFKKSLLAIHHHRVAYPQTKDISGKKKAAEKKAKDKEAVEAPEEKKEKKEKKKAPAAEDANKPELKGDEPRQPIAAHMSDDFTVIPLPRDPRRKAAEAGGGTKKKKQSKKSDSGSGSK